MTENGGSDMTEDDVIKAKQSVSALMDDEANDLDVARALRGVADSDDLRAFWRRQQLVRESMQGSAFNTASLDVSDAVKQAIAADTRRYANPLVSMAVAASVTVAVVLGSQQALLLNTQPLNAVTAPGAVVQMPGAGVIQASFEESSVPQLRSVLSTQASPSIQSDQYTNRVSYNRVASERLQSLLSVHYAAASEAPITPFVTRSIAPEMAP
ncbi:MAG: sigma-E factor negative regulatory protein [Proteobacteria bacterium]|nr:sigma-E factor negative regulatory protein [Pseudomonadota bacterium]